MTTPPISRRTFLRGLGTAMALPMLEAMLPLNALAQSARSRTVRMAFLFVPNGAHMQAWTPEQEGVSFALPYIMEPLQNVRDYIMPLTGLTQDKARPNGDGAGDHARSSAAWLTGCQPRKTAGADIRAGVSVDQIAARHVGKYTRFPSLEIGCEPGGHAGNCDSGYSCAYSNAISWRAESTPMAKETDVRALFERLFSNGDPNESKESRERRNRERLSLLDLVQEDAAQLKSKLGAHDRAKLDEYFTGVREIERQLARVNANAAQFATLKAPEDTPQTYSDRVKLMCDMLALAFQADLTRVCTFMLANEGSNHAYREIGIADGHHDLSHHGNNPEKQDKIRQINRYHVTHLAYLLEKLRSIHEGDSTLLDNSMVVYGGGISDGDRHNHDNLPVLLAGRGGKSFHSGRHVRYANETPMTNLFLTMLDRVGVPVDHLGDSTGRLQQLF